MPALARPIQPMIVGSQRRVNAISLFNCQARPSQPQLLVAESHLLQMVQNVLPLVELFKTNRAVGCINKQTNIVLNAMTLKHMHLKFMSYIFLLATDMAREG